MLTNLAVITLYLNRSSNNQTHTPRKALFLIQKEREIIGLLSWLKENRTTNQFNGTFIVNKDEFGIPDNEPHLYLRSAYLDYRLNPPKAWVLAVAGKDLKSQNAQCFYHFKASGSKKERTEAISTTVYSDIKSSCFFRLLILQCDLSSEKPDYVTITFNDKGINEIIFSLYIGLNGLFFLFDKKVLTNFSSNALVGLKINRRKPDVEQYWQDFRLVPENFIRLDRRLYSKHHIFYGNATASRSRPSKFWPKIILYFIFYQSMILKLIFWLKLNDEYFTGYSL